MIDPELERRTADCTELLDAWRQFLDLANKAIKPPKTVTPQLEEQFLIVKARIAMLHDSFMDSILHDRQVAQNMMAIVNRSITLRSLAKVTEAEIKKTELEWHECFLLLNETVTSLNEERARLAEINEMSHNMKRALDRLRVQARAFFSSIYFKIGVVLAVIVFTIWGVPALGIYDWDNLRDVRQLQGPVTRYLDIKRNLGMQAAYYDLANFKQQIPRREDINGINDVTAVTADHPKEDRVDQMRFLDPQIRQTLLEQSSQYEAQRFLPPGNRPAAIMMVFWFRNTRDAINVEINARQNAANIPAGWRVYRKANVICAVRSDNNQTIETVETEVINKIKPTG